MNMSKELKTGIVALIIIAIGIWGYNFLKGQNLFSPGARYFLAEYNNVEGVTEASFVTISGMNVGKVTDIRFNPEKKGKVIVEFSVNKDYNFSKNSVAKIYSAGLMGGQNIAILPNYEGENAVSGDVLKGEVEAGLLNSVSEKLTPLQQKLNNVLGSADSLLIGLNEVLDKKARTSLNKSVVGLEHTLNGVQKTLASVNALLAENKTSLKGTLDNAKKITDDFSVVSNDLAKANLGETIKKLETTLTQANTMLAGINNGKGTVGKLMTNEEVYTNLTNATKELEELLRELKLNPKRFLHFSLFGKKAKPYNEENNNNNTSNK